MDILTSGKGIPDRASNSENETGSVKSENVSGMAHMWEWVLVMLSIYLSMCYLLWLGVVGGA